MKKEQDAKNKKLPTTPQPQATVVTQEPKEAEHDPKQLQDTASVFKTSTASNVGAQSTVKTAESSVPSSSAGSSSYSTTKGHHRSFSMGHMSKSVTELPSDGENVNKCSAVTPSMSMDVTGAIPKQGVKVKRGTSFREDLLSRDSDHDLKVRQEPQIRSKTPTPGEDAATAYSPKLSMKKTDSKSRKLKLGSKAADLLAKLQMKWAAK